MGQTVPYVKFPKLGLGFEVNDVAFTVGNLEIKWYAICIAVGLLLAFIFAMFKAKKFGLDADKVFDAAFFGTIGGLVGARLYYVIFAFDQYKNDLWSILDIRRGGLAIYGGLIGGLLVGLLVCKIRKIKILPLLDMAGIGFLIGQGIGRWGNFFNVEAYGSATELPWGMTSTQIVYDMEKITGKFDPNVMVHPCFLYESLWCILGAVLLFIYIKHRKFDGEIFLMYVGWYGFERAIVEGLRTDSLMLFNTGIRVSQALSALLFIAAVALLIYFRIKIKKQRKVDPLYRQLYVDTEESKELLRIAEEKANQPGFFARRKMKKQAQKLEEQLDEQEHVVPVETLEEIASLDEDAATEFENLEEEDMPLRDVEETLENTETVQQTTEENIEQVSEEEKTGEKDTPNA